jgi:hypothetical protein
VAESGVAESATLQNKAALLGRVTTSPR